jgi:hypothetical protein
VLRQSTDLLAKYFGQQTGSPFCLFILCDKVLSYLSVCHNFALSISPPIERRGAVEFPVLLLLSHHLTWDTRELTALLAVITTGQFERPRNSDDAAIPKSMAGRLAFPKSFGIWPCTGSDGAKSDSG